MLRATPSKRKNCKAQAASLVSTDSVATQQSEHEINGDGLLDSIECELKQHLHINEGPTYTGNMTPAQEAIIPKVECSIATEYRIDWSAK